MTGTRLPRPPWPWADPFWLARKQFEAVRLMMRLTESVVDASVSSVLGASDRAAVRPAPSTPSPSPTPAPAAARTPAPVVATLTVTAPAPAERASSVVTAPAPARQAAPVVTVPAPAPAPRSAPVPVPNFDTERAPAGKRLVPVPAEAAKPPAAAEPVVPGWDELSLGSIRARLRRLSEEDLVALHSYEENHTARADVLSMLENRLTKVRSEK